MRLFECLDGTLINPLLMTTCEITETGDSYMMTYGFAGGGLKAMYYESKKTAQSELDRFKEHFESME